ncbi:Tyrosine phosphatase [Entamoeba marina]
MTEQSSSKQDWVGNIYNFRGIDNTKVVNGKIKPNHVYRGGFYFNKGKEDIITLKAEKHISSFVDLRSSDEVPADYPKMVEDAGLSYFNAPLIPFWRSVLYMILRVSFKDFIHCGVMMIWALLTFQIGLFVKSMKSSSTSFPLGWFFPVIYHYGQKELLGLFKFIATHSEHPFIFFCSFGKDRTGLIGCMLEMLLGATVEECIKDYKLSDRNLKDHLVVAKDHFKTFGGNEKGMELAKTNSQLIVDFDNFIQKNYGTIDRYFIDFIGLKEEEINAIRRNCLLFEEE